MNNNNQFILQVFEKIGVPLFASVNDFSSRAIMSGQAKDGLTSAEQAEIIAKLLTNVTQASAIISSKLGLEEKDPEADDIHVSMAAILSPVISNMYQITGNVLSEEDIEKVSSSFETIANFSSHFSSIKDGGERINNITANGDVQDEKQNKLQYILGMVPIINSVSAFSFGEDQGKLLTKIVQRIENETQRIEKNLPDEIKNDSNTSSKVINVVSMMYSQCHFSEMARIMSLSDKERETSAITIDNVWKIFDQKISMLEMLVNSMIPNDNKIESSVSTPHLEREIDTPIEEPKEEPKQENNNSGDNSQTTPSSSNASSGNPMSFFSGKNSETTEADG